MVLISKSGNVTTTISFFKIDPEYQKRQVDLLRKYIDDKLSKQTGFISSTIHRGLKGSTIVNYSQWMTSNDNNGKINVVISPEPQSLVSFASHEINSYEIIHELGGDMTFRDDDKVVTSITYVRLNSKNQDNYANEWLSVFETIISRQPGFISARLHKSETGNRFVTYVHWAKLEDLDAMLALPEVFKIVDRAASFSKSDWSTYEINYLKEISEK